MEQLGVAVLVFALRLVDVSVGTLRVLYTVRGQALRAAGLGAVEAGVFIFAISRVFKYVDSPLAMAGYALGFAAGTALGIALEKWIASGLLLVRVVSRDGSQRLQQSLREAGFGVTRFTGEGREGPVDMLFVVTQRKRGDDLLAIVRAVDEDAFVTVESVNVAVGGYIPLSSAAPAAVRK